LQIYPVFGIAGSGNDDNREDGAIGNFFVQFCAANQCYGGTRQTIEQHSVAPILFDHHSRAMSEGVAKYG
jgi:hypothetical protein